MLISNSSYSTNVSIMCFDTLSRLLFSLYTYCVVSRLTLRSTLMTLGYIPAQSAALTTAQFSELVLRSRMSPPPLALTNPEALN